MSRISSSKRLSNKPSDAKIMISPFSTLTVNCCDDTWEMIC
jgi:hypothetical protein